MTHGIATTLTLLIVAAAALGAAPAQASDGNIGFLLAGSGLAWAGFFGYAFYIGRKNRETRREIEELRDQLGKRNGDKP